MSVDERLVPDLWREDTGDCTGPWNLPSCEYQGDMSCFSETTIIWENVLHGGHGDGFWRPPALR